MVDEYHRLRVENEHLKGHLAKLNESFKSLSSNLTGRQETLLKKLKEMQETRSKLEHAHVDMKRRLHKPSSVVVAKPVASRLVPSNGDVVTGASAFQPIELRFKFCELGDKEMASNVTTTVTQQE